MKNLLRNFFYASGIIAALSFTVHQWATPVGASGLTQAAGNVVGVANGVVLSSSGNRYTAYGSTGSYHWGLERAMPSLPIPASSIAMVGGSQADLLIDTSGGGWVWDGTQWNSLGPLPDGSGPTAVTPQTWSQIKGKYAPQAGGVH